MTLIEDHNAHVLDRTVHLWPVRPWYLLHTGTNGVASTEERLERHDIEVFYPTGKRWKTIRRTREVRERVFPAFPRYLFFRFDGRPDWKAVRGGGEHTEHFDCGNGKHITMHVVDPDEGVTVVSLNGAPVRIDHEIIVELRGMEHEGRFNIGTKPGRSGRTLVLKPNDEVLIVAGPLEGYTAYVKAKPKSRKVDIVVPFLGRYDFPTVIDIEALQLALTEKQNAA